MDIKIAVEKIWQNQKPGNTSLEQVLSTINKDISSSIEELAANQKTNARQAVENAFANMLLALKMLDIDPDDVIQRRLGEQAEARDKTMHIFSDRVEIRVGNEVKGGWTLWSPEDLADALKVAQEFRCRVIREIDFPEDTYEGNHTESENG